MKMTSMEEYKELAEFVELASGIFAKDPQVTTATASSIAQGCLFAVRWGLSRDCILVFRLDESFEPTIFQQAIPKDSI